MAKTTLINGKPEAETKEAGYIWLPIRFDGERAYVVWEHEWKIEDWPVSDGPEPWWKKSI